MSSLRSKLIGTTDSASSRSIFARSTRTQIGKSSLDRRTTARTFSLTDQWSSQGGGSESKVYPCSLTRIWKADAKSDVNRGDDVAARPQCTWDRTKHDHVKGAASIKENRPRPNGISAMQRFRSVAATMVADARTPFKSRKTKRHLEKELNQAQAASSPSESGAQVVAICSKSFQPKAAQTNGTRQDTNQRLQERRDRSLDSLSSASSTVCVNSQATLQRLRERCDAMIQTTGITAAPQSSATLEDTMKRLRQRCEARSRAPVSKVAPQASEVLQEQGERHQVRSQDSISTVALQAPTPFLQGLRERRQARSQARVSTSAPRPAVSPSVCLRRLSKHHEAGPEVPLGSAEDLRVPVLKPGLRTLQERQEAPDLPLSTISRGAESQVSNSSGTSRIRPQVSRYCSARSWAPSTASSKATTSSSKANDSLNKVADESRARSMIRPESSSHLAQPEHKPEDVRDITKDGATILYRSRVARGTALRFRANFPSYGEVLVSPAEPAHRSAVPVRSALKQNFSVRQQPRFVTFDDRLRTRDVSRWIQ